MKKPDWVNAKTALYGAAAALSGLVAVAAFASPAGAWPLAALALACVAAANIDQFQEISAGTSGVKAVIREAKNEISNLREVVELTSEFQLSAMQQMGRFAHNDDNEMEANLQRMLELMKKAGLPEDRIMAIKRVAWDRWVLFDYVVAITGGNYIPKTNDPGVQSRWKALRDFYRQPSPADLRDFLDDVGDRNPLRRELLASYEHYLANGTHLREELWGRRDEVPQVLGDMSRASTRASTGQK